MRLLRLGDGGRGAPGRRPGRLPDARVLPEPAPLLGVRSARDSGRIAAEPCQLVSATGNNLRDKFTAGRRCPWAWAA